MRRLQENKGITLIALVVTIILLLILAGMSIAMVNGSGLFTKTKESSEKYKQADIVEKLTLLSQDTLIELQLQNKELSLQNFTDTLCDLASQQDLNVELYESSEEGAKLICENHLFNIDNNLLISDAGILDTVLVIAKVNNTTGWVKSINDGVLIDGTIKVYNATITEAFISKNGTKIEDLSLNQNGEFSYLANENGTYKIEARSSNGKQGSREVEVDVREDNVNPDSFTPTAVIQENTITISANTQDNSGGSGISHYEYSLKLDGVEKNPNIKSNTITVTEYGSFTIEVTAYDKAGNKTTGSTTIEIEDPENYYLLKAGTSYISRTGEWSRYYDYDDTRTSITFPNNTICINSSSLNRTGSATTSNYIDLTNYTTFKAKYTFSGDYSGNVYFIPRSGSTISYEISLGTTSKEIDISGLTGEYAIRFKNGMYSYLNVTDVFVK